MQDYAPNPNRFNGEKRVVEKKKVEKIVKGKATIKKKKGIRKFTEGFVSEEAANVGSYIWSDWIMPTVKQTLVDVIRNSAEMIFLGKVNHGGGSRSSSSSPYVPYDRFSNKRDDRSYSSSRSSFHMDGEISFEDREDAVYVLEQMDERLAKYGVVSVADMYDMAGITCPYTANRYGWGSLRSAEIVRTSDGYVIRLPKADAI